MVHITISRFENTIRNLPREKCAIFTEDGHKIIEKVSGYQGAREIVGFDKEESIKIVGRILTHNHPSCRLFTEDDVKTAVDIPLAEIRVVTKRGTFSLDPIDGKWPIFSEICMKYREYRCDWDYIPGDRSEFQNLAREYEWVSADEDWYMQHKCWTRVSETLGMVYKSFILK
jgi:hypothetical protein